MSSTKARKSPRFFQKSMVAQAFYAIRMLSIRSIWSRELWRCQNALYIADDKGYHSIWDFLRQTSWMQACRGCSWGSAWVKIGAPHWAFISRLNDFLAGVKAEAGARESEHKKYRQWEDKSYCLSVRTPWVVLTALWIALYWGEERKRI